MSDCCSGAALISHHPAVKASAPVSEARQRCQEHGGRAVERRTMLQMLKPDRFEHLENLEFNFCPEPTCTVVYYSSDATVKFTNDDLREKVGLKMQGDPSARVCYCFGYTEGMIADELETAGQTTIPKKITEFIKAGMCACEVRNPAGVCCLGNVNQAVKRLSEEYKEVEN
jgi:hypothetical protein